MAPKRKAGDEDKGSPGKRPSAPPPPLASLFAPRNQIPPPLPKNLLAFPKELDGTTKLSTWNVRSLHDASSRKKEHAFRKWVEAEDHDVLVLTEAK